MKDCIQIAFGLYDKSGDYTRYIATTIISILENTKYDVCIHILHDESIDNDKKHFLLSIVKKYKQSIKFYLVSLDKVLLNFNKNIGTFFRLYIFEKCNVDKIIYLDGDVLITNDIYKLWETNIEDYYCAVVRDIKETREIVINTKYYHRININYNNYFNAGVIYFNCKKIRNSFNVKKELVRFFEKNKYISMFDQDFLNYLLQERLIILNKKFNFIANNINDITDNDFNENVIIHFAGPFKPWNCNNEKVIYYYYRYFLKIFSKDNIDEFCRYMSYLPKSNFKRMGLKHALLEYKKENSIFLSISCILKGILSDKYFYKLAYYIIKYIKIKILYNIYYVLKK